MFLSLGVILILAVGVTWWFRRTGKARLTRFNASSKIKILERRPLSQKSALYLVEVGGKRIVVADSPAGLRQITDLPPATHSPFPQVLAEKSIEKTE